MDKLQRPISLPPIADWYPESRHPIYAESQQIAKPRAQTTFIHRPYISSWVSREGYESIEESMAYHAPKSPSVAATLRLQAVLSVLDNPGSPSGKATRNLTRSALLPSPFKTTKRTPTFQDTSKPITDKVSANPKTPETPSMMYKPGFPTISSHTPKTQPTGQSHVPNYKRRWLKMMDKRKGSEVGPSTNPQSDNICRGSMPFAGESGGNLSLSVDFENPTTPRPVCLETPALPAPVPGEKLSLKVTPVTPARNDHKEFSASGFVKHGSRQKSPLLVEGSKCEHEHHGKRQKKSRREAKRLSRSQLARFSHATVAKEHEYIDLFGLNESSNERVVGVQWADGSRSIEPIENIPKEDIGIFREKSGPHGEMKVVDAREVNGKKFYIIGCTVLVDEQWMKEPLMKKYRRTTE